MPMTATDELRKMLDERSVRWDYGVIGQTSTRFNVNGVDLTFVPKLCRLVCSTILTPRQVITVLRGDECEMKKLDRYDGMQPSYKCTVCWHENFENKVPSYCPKCGRKVKGEC